LQTIVSSGNLIASAFFVSYEQFMPAAPLWVHRLEDTLPLIASLPHELIDRRTLEELLGVGKWTAWRILRRCGAEEGPGGALVCSRDRLVQRLRAIQQDGRCAPEIARRQRTERYLDGMLEYATRKHKEIARETAATALVSSRFGDLPAGVDLQPRELRITFSGTNDFLQKFGAVVFALKNDFERLSEFIDTPVATGSITESK
jgi:hypothetical protein